MKDEWKVGRIIARPFIGTSKDNFKRTAKRHDYALSPFKRTYMNILKDNNYEIIQRRTNLEDSKGVKKTASNSSTKKSSNTKNKTSSKSTKNRLKR